MKSKKPVVTTAADALIEIEKLKKCNSAAKDVRAKMRGFKDAQEYRQYLDNLVKGVSNIVEAVSTAKKKVVKEKPAGLPRILIIDAIDRSGSMGFFYSMGSKINRCYTGIKDNLSDLYTKHNKEAVYYHQLIDFGCVVTPHNVSSLDDRYRIPQISDGGATALYHAIDVAYLSARQQLATGIIDKVLINFYTDGEDYGTRYGNKGLANSRIKDSLESDNITFTFICTESDKHMVRSRLGVDESNILVYDNTGEGIAKAMKITQSARKSYTASVSRGESVKTGFYKRIIKKN